MPTAAESLDKAQQKTALGCFAVLVLMLGSCFLIFKPDNSPEAQRQKAEEQSLLNTQVSTTLVCEEAVKRRLKAPATADFPFGHSNQVRGVVGYTNRYRLSSYVDAQNSFGANLRTNFVCVVEGKGESLLNYKLIELTGLDQ